MWMNNSEAAAFPLAYQLLDYIIFCAHKITIIIIIVGDGIKRDKCANE